MATDNNQPKIGRYVILALILLLGIGIVTGSFYTVGPGERGILLHLGDPDLTSVKSGLHFKAPFIDKIVYMDIQTQKYETTATAASKDLQNVNAKLAVNYHLVADMVPYVYKDIGQAYGDKVIMPAIQEVVKASTAQFTAEELITQRSKVKELIDKNLQDRLLKYNIVLETTSLTDFQFSAQFNAAIEQKVTAQQQALTAQNTLAKIQFEALQTITQQNATAQSLILKGNAEAQANLAVVKAQADGKLLLAQAEAESLRLQKAELTPQLLLLRQIEVQREYATHWNGELPRTIMGGGQIPLIQLPQSMIDDGSK